MKLINRLPTLTAAVLLGFASAATLLMAPVTVHAQATTAAPAPAPAPDAAAPATTPTPAPPPGAGVDAQPQKEIIENPYGLEALWQQGDFVSRGTPIILAIMSMGSWYIMFVKVYEQAKLFRQYREAQAKFRNAGTIPA